MARINIIAWDNNRGLTCDIRIMSLALTALGHQVRVIRLGSRRNDGAWKLRLMRVYMRLRWLLTLGRQPARDDVNIALEHVRPACFGLARINLLAPNPEWLSPRSQRYLPRFDAILTKTHEATRIFKERGFRTLHMGFRSYDCLNPDAVREPDFLHLAGASPMKGTARLLEVWKRHPEWPKLLILQSPRTAPKPVPQLPNVEYRVGYLDDASEIRRLQNSHAFQLCLSETEGWGHYIAEAMSCKAVTITCDAAPMNELVTAERGILVDATSKRTFNVATLHAFDEASLERAVERAIAMSREEREAIGQRAREWFEANERGFVARVDAALRAVL
jgi:hypothetical protein